MATTERPLSRQRWMRLLVGVLPGAVTGVLLVLVAQFLVRGEPQLLVGVAGMWLAAAGAVAGFILALRRTDATHEGH